jgi:hypothetical protein
LALDPLVRRRTNSGAIGPLVTCPTFYPVVNVPADGGRRRHGVHATVAETALSDRRARPAP